MPAPNEEPCPRSRSLTIAKGLRPEAADRGPHGSTMTARHAADLGGKRAGPRLRASLLGSLAGVIAMLRKASWET